MGGSGHIYCFNTLTDYRIYKAGHTQQPLASRLRGYLGPSRPRTVVGSRCVIDSERAEVMFLRLLKQSNMVTVRSDLGNEWFEATPTVDTETRHANIIFLMDIVQRAVGCDTSRVECSRDTSSHSEFLCTTSLGASTLPNMDLYFKALDEFVATACEDTLGRGVPALVDRFEASDDCPIFADFVPWDRFTRVSVVQSRFPHL